MKKTILDFLNEVSIECGYSGWYNVFSCGKLDYGFLNHIPQEAGKRFSDQQKIKVYQSTEESS